MGGELQHCGRSSGGACRLCSLRFECASRAQHPFQPASQLVFSPVLLAFPQVLKGGASGALRGPQSAAGCPCRRLHASSTAAQCRPMATGVVSPSRNSNLICRRGHV